MSLHGAGVLAGAYRGGGMERTLLTHAVSDVSVALGRLKRDAEQAFCRPTLNMVDRYGWEPAAAISCPQCLAILAAKGLKVAA